MVDYFRYADIPVPIRPSMSALAIYRSSRSCPTSTEMATESEAKDLIYLEILIPGGSPDARLDQQYA
jgi:hypothetical protein